MSSPSEVLKEAGWLNSEQSAALLGTSVVYLRGLVQRNRLRPTYVGRDLYFHVDDLETFKRDHPRIGKRRATPSV